MWGTRSSVAGTEEKRRKAGRAEFMQALEGTVKQRLAPQKGGRPPEAGMDARQSELVFELE